ncbi:hypothetical protein R3P38DRAFT_3277174 [Favolaschia claudopus]|uniref:Uncharacterized protein n=1 Tax=Favolaschia claudopus TaxID=2862362 RepID=A0AAW0ALZ4_9AGAR
MSQVVCENINEVNNTRNLPSSLPDEDTQASWDLVRLKMASPEFRKQVPAPIIENRPPPFEFTDSLSRPSALIESRSFKPLYPIPSPSKDESNIYNWIPTGEALVREYEHEVQAIETALEHAKLKLAHARYILAKTAFILQPIHRVPLELWTCGKRAVTFYTMLQFIQLTFPPLTSILIHSIRLPPRRTRERHINCPLPPLFPNSFRSANHVVYVERMNRFEWRRER